MTETTHRKWVKQSIECNMSSRDTTSTYRVVDEVGDISTLCSVHCVRVLVPLVVVKVK